MGVPYFWLGYPLYGKGTCGLVEVPPVGLGALSFGWGTLILFGVPLDGYPLFGGDTLRFCGGAFGLLRYPWLLSFWRGYSLFCWGTLGLVWEPLLSVWIGYPRFCWDTLDLLGYPLYG